MLAQSPAIPQIMNIDIQPFMPQSFARPYNELMDSIKTLGLISPIIVFHDHQGPRIVAGQRRCRALVEMGIKEAPVLNMGNISQQQAAAMAIGDNLSRGWNEAEKVLIWGFLENSFSASQAISLSRPLGLERSQKLRQWASLASKLPMEAINELAADKLDLETAARLARLSYEDFFSLWPFFKELEPSKQKKKLWLDYLEDLSRMENRRISSFLSEKPFDHLLTLAKEKGRLKAEEEGRGSLWRLRYPLLSALSARRKEQLKSLSPGKGLKLDLDWNFEDLFFKLSFDFSSADEFSKMARAVEQLDGNPALHDLFQDDESLLASAKEAAL